MGAVARLFPTLEERASFSITELARVFGVTVQAVHQWLKNGKLRGVTRTSARGNYRIPRREFVRLLRESGRSVPGIWEEPSPPRLKLLFIDDDPQIRRLVKDFSECRWIPLEAKTAPTVEDGIVLAAQFLPDVIFLDYFFADDRLRGDQALAFIRGAKARRKVRVVGMSCHARIGRKMLEAGADGFLRKPFTLGALKEAILAQTARGAASR